MSFAQRIGNWFGGLSLSLAAACNNGGASEVVTNEGRGRPADPASLRVTFEAIELQGEPAMITDFAFYPGSDTDFLALDKSGTLRRYSLAGRSATLVANARVAGVFDRLDCGAISLAFEPDFREGKYLYVGTCASLTHSAVLRLELDEDMNPVAGSEVSIIEVGDDQANRPWHNIGSIGFEPNGILWALFGDKVRGSPAQDPGQELGKLVRIKPSRKRDVGGFEPAPDNPVLDDPNAAPSVFALGLRSPFRGTRDSRGRYWIGDVGSDAFEEVNVVTKPMQNFGWPGLEGPCEDCGETTGPTFYWGRKQGTPRYIADDPDTETTVARVAWAGPEVVRHEPDRYGGLLAGSVLFGDYCAGFLRQARLDDATGAPTLDAPLGHLNNVSALRQHSDGYVYAATFGSCQTDVKNAADEPMSKFYRMVPLALETGE